MAAVQRDLPAVAVDRRDDELADLGTLTCTALAANRPRGTAAAEIASATGITPADAGSVIELARKTACRP